MKKQQVTVSMSMPKRMRALARQAAYDDNRSLSSLFNVLVKKYLEQEGYLDEWGEPGPKALGPREPRQTHLNLK